MAKTIKMQAEEAFERGEFEEAEVLFRQVLLSLELSVGGETFEVASTLHCLARVLEKLGRLPESAAARERADKILCHST